jgi:hypothetical protein
MTKQIFLLGKTLKKYNFGGGGAHGESFDEASVLDKSKEGIVVAIFAGFTLGSFRG